MVRWRILLSLQNANVRANGRRSLIGLMVLALCWGPLLAQPAREQQVVSLTGSDVPIYYQVEVFFRQASTLFGLEGEDRVFYHQFLEKLSFKPGSAEEQALATVLHDFADLEQNQQRSASAVEAELAQLVDDEPAYWKRLNEWERQKAGELGDLYRKLAEALKAVGSSIEVVEAFINRHVSPHTNLTSDQLSWVMFSPRLSSVALGQKLQSKT